MYENTFTAEDIALVERGLARIHAGRLIPVMRGGDPEIDPIYPDVPEDIAALSDEDLAAFVSETTDALAEVAADPHAFVVEGERSGADLVEATRTAKSALDAAKAEQASRVETVEVEASAELSDDEFAAEIASLTDGVTAAADDEPEDEPEEPAAAEEPIVASAAEPAAAAARVRPRPTRERQAVERTPRVSLVASVEGPKNGQEIDVRQAAELMMERRKRFGNLPPETVINEPICRATWSHLYPDERRLGSDEEKNYALVAAVTDSKVILQHFEERKANALTASGGLCAPVTPYYNLQMISTAGRPVRGALAAFNADRGGIRYARPAGLGDVTSAVGAITADDDAAGGTFAQKSCQVVPCPTFQETDVTSVFHCLQHGNLGSRTFPERVMQWNSLTLAAHARFAEGLLLSAIKGFATNVTAASLGLGVVGSLVGQVLAAAAGIRSRNRMDDQAVLRVLLPSWAIPLMMSDSIRSEFYRLDTDAARLQALFRDAFVEPTFYLDGSSDGGQVFGTQSAGALLPFPDTIEWAIYPEGTFLFLDGGTLELGIVRDSVLNATNDYQIFGETFENVAFVGVEALWVTSDVCDSGIVAGTHNTPCPIDYTHTS